MLRKKSRRFVLHDFLDIDTVPGYCKFDEHVFGWKDIENGAKAGSFHGPRQRITRAEKVKTAFFLRF